MKSNKNIYVITALDFQNNLKIFVNDDGCFAFFDAYASSLNHAYFYSSIAKANEDIDMIKAYKKYYKTIDSNTLCVKEIMFC